MPRPLLLPVLLFAAAFVAGCPNDRIQRTLPPDVRVDTYSQQAASKIDVLWVVDNSGSMLPRQQNLARNFSSFIDVFRKNSVDFRIAVTTTDIFAKPKGALRGNPAILTPTTPNLVQAFQNNINVGADGSPYEAGLEAAVNALDARGEVNKPELEKLQSCKDACATDAKPFDCIDRCHDASNIQFLRPDAFLYIIFVTDEEDQSAADVRYFWRRFETANGVGNDGTVTTAAIIGDYPSNGCGAIPGERYLRLTELTGGELGSICDNEFAATLRKLATNAVGLKRKFALGLAPNVETIEVRVIYPCNVSSDALTGCASVDRAACEGQPAESYNLTCTPPQGGVDGWTYEAQNKSIFFAGESVPGVNAHLEIQYYEEGKP